VPAALVTRLERLEAARRVADKARHDAAVRELGRTMTADHIRLVQDWMREHFGSLEARIALRGESPAATLARLRPPTLVRAVWLLLDAHLRTGCPVSFSPDVAEVYLTDPDAYPADPCAGCGYPLPIHGTLRPDGSFRDVAWYVGACPVCGHTTDPEEESTP
jgi:hypothetical protein